MKKILLAIVACLFLAGCNTGANGENGFESPLSQDIGENGLGIYTQTKELKSDSPEMQPPAGCPTGAEIDPRLKTNMSFDGSMRLLTDDRFAAATFSQTINSITPESVASRFQILQTRGLGTTIQAGQTFDSTCTKNANGWGCESSGNVNLPPEHMKYQNCGIQNATSWDSKYGMGTYKTASGAQYNVIYTKWTTNGNVVCRDTGVDMGPGTSTYISIETPDMITPTFRFQCRAGVSLYTRLEASGKVLLTQQHQTGFRN